MSASDVFEAVHTDGGHGNAGVGITINGTLYPQSSGTTTVFSFTGTVNSIGIVGTNSAGIILYALKLNGVPLVDSGVVGYRGSATVNSAFNSSLLVSRVSGEIKVGDYLLAQETQMASWLYATRKKAQRLGQKPAA